MAQDTDEHTPAERNLGRREYDAILLRFDKVDRFNAAILERADEAFSKSFEAHQTARAAVLLRSTWAPYAFSLVLAFTTAMIVIACAR
jgi:hypothetical protein